MPIFTTPISNQNTGNQSGISGYPQIGSVKQYTIISDEFNRSTLNPTNALVLYTGSAGQGTGTNNISTSLNLVQIITSGVSGDNRNLRTSGWSFSRAANFIDNRSQLSFDIVWGNSDSTACKYFIGLINSDTPITALPTTAIHMGIYLDTAVSGNFKLSSANGTTQVTTDTTQAADGNVYRLNILWNGPQSATLSLYKSASGTGTNDLTSLVKQQTVSALSASITLGFELQFFIVTNAAAAKELDILEWQCQAT